MLNRIILVTFALTIGAGPVLADSRTLQNGSVVIPYPDQYYWDQYSYYGCLDAQLDPDTPDANLGGLTEHGLIAGSQRRVIIQFRELHRAIGPNKQITGAALRLYAVPGAWSTGNEVTITRLLQPWRQGSHDDELTSQHWACSWTHRLYSADAGEAQTWDAPGAAGIGTDRASAPASVGDTGNNYNFVSWLVDGLEADVTDFYEKRTTNCGWVIEYSDPATASGSNLFYTSEAADVALRPQLIITYIDDPDPPARDLDLNVTYIRRTPEYYRYEPVYEYKSYHDANVGLMHSPGFADTQKWPANGETVTFTAEVINKGISASSGAFDYRWLINGEVVATGTDAVGLAPGEAGTYELDWVWDCNDYLDGNDPHRNSLDHRDRTVTFEVDYHNALTEQSENNNALTDFIEAPGMGFYVEQSMYDMFNERLNQVGSYSFEDWVQWQVRVWNESFLEMSRFADLAEDGCLERVRVQKIEVWPDGTLCGGGNHVPNCQTNFLIDGEWGFLSSLQYAEKWSLLIERGLLHECTHQIGMIDLYTMNMEAGTPSSPLKVQVKDGRPYYISRGYYPAWGGLMGGGDTRYSDEYESTGLMSGWTIGALNTNTGYRRGFYGEQLYDVPDVLRLRAVDASGAAIPFAELKVWQSRAGATPDELLYDWQPIFEGVADETGVVTLPNYGTLESDPVTTITGHTLKPNPWGRTNVVGTNGSLLVKISGYGQYDYTFMRVSQINRQYWLGVTNELTYDLTVQIAPTYNLGLDNIAIGTSASSNAGGGPWYAVDGNLNTRWDIGSADVGDYLQVDLGEVHDLGWVILTQNDYAGDFFNKFRIDVSLTGAFTGEEVLFAHETVGWWNASGTRRDIDPDNESILRVRYAGPVTAARYVRLTCEDPRWTKLAELEIYPALPGDDTTPPAQVADLEVTDTSLSAAVLTWTTPGDDGWEGTATAYDLRYATFPLNPADFELATPAADVPTPWEGGLPETYVLGELQPGTQHWVALKAVDDVGNWSSMSNVVTFTTAPEGEPFEVETLTAPANSSFASGLASDTQHLYFLRRDDGSFYRTLDGTNWTTLVGPEADLGGWHGDWSSGILDYYPGMGDAGALYITHRDTAGDDVQLLALYDIAEGFWYWTPKWPVFGHGATISGGYIYGLARSWGWNTGGATQRLHLTSPTQIYAERTALSGINGEADDWFSRASHLAALDGWIYGIKNDWTTPAGTGDRLFRFQTVDFEPSVCNGTLPDDLTNWDVWETHSTPAEDLAELPFEVGYGSALVALPPDWSPDVGSQGGLFIVAGNSPANNEGWGEASDICALFDIATRTLRVATLPGVTGNGTSAALHDGAVYVKRGQLPGGAYSDDIWRLTPLSVTTPGDTNCDGFVDFDDIHPFVKALSGPDEYYALYPDCDWMSADCDGNGAVDFDDIDDFISLIGG